MDATTLARLEEFEKDKKFYDALQFYRTKVTRSFRLKNAGEVAIPLVKHALDFFFREKQYQCAVDIATQYVECLSKNNVDLNGDSFDVIADSVAEFAKIAELEQENEQMEQLLSAARCRIVDLAIQWTKQKSASFHDKKYGSPRFHSHLAKAFNNVKHAELARTHYILSDDAAGFARFLKDQEDNYELTITETVLQLLCLDRFPFAKALFEAYVAPSTLPFDIPLLNFTHIMFDVVETENRLQFADLSEKYSPELARRPAFIGYITRMGRMYFGIRDQQNMGLGFSALLGNLLGGQKEDEPASSHRSDRTPARAPAPSAAPPSLESLLGPIGRPSAAKAPPKPAPKPEEVEEDLD